LPEFREGHFVLGVSTAPAHRWKRRAGSAPKISKALLANSAHRDGRAADRSRRTRGTPGARINRSFTSISSRSRRRGGGRVAEIHKILESVPGIQFEVLTFLGDRIGESISGVTAPWR